MRILPLIALSALALSLTACDMNYIPDNTDTGSTGYVDTGVPAGGGPAPAPYNGGNVTPPAPVPVPHGNVTPPIPPPAPNGGGNATPPVPPPAPNSGSHNVTPPPPPPPAPAKPTLNQVKKKADDSNSN